MAAGLRQWLFANVGDGATTGFLRRREAYEEVQWTISKRNGC
jgi:hypothetical protein